MRDDFTKQTITEIAKAVGYRCSNPDCLRATVGANAAQDGTITIGVAAHIRAASAGGPRYDLTQTQQERRGRDNGIWLCQSCGRLIDADPQKFSIEVLGNWKRLAQDRAFRELVAPSAGATTEEAARIGAIAATDNASLRDINFDTLLARFRAVAKTDLVSFQKQPGHPASTVELTLRIFDDDNIPPFSISHMPTALEVAPEVVFVAPPGTGKTTTLLQLAGALIETQSIIPIYVRLGDWSAGNAGLLDSLQLRPAFSDIEPRSILETAQRGRLLLLLDGWNELDNAARRRLRIDLDGLRRSYPSLRIIVTTRRQFLDVPILGPRVAIDALSDDQQMAIARNLAGTDGEKVVDEAWRTPGVRELIAIPLYLSALVSIGAGGVTPTTKEAILRLFVEQHEQAPEHAEALQAILFGCHSEILAALASQMTRAGTTTLSEGEARKVVAAAMSRLRADGQIAAQPEPAIALEALTSHHTLNRFSNEAISFQHQQFQEWFASHEVARMMRASAQKTPGAQATLAVEILDRPIWEEPILFAVDRLSGESDGTDIVAHVVRVALTIDPMLAAEMIFRSSLQVWDMVRNEVMDFAHRWHRPGKVDRAARFMIMTGRPEFEPQIWPLVSSEDSQIQLPILRSAPRFRPSVLGPRAPSRIAALPEDVREHLLALIASESGIDGMDLATDIAKTDPSPRVQAEVVQHLQFRRAGRHVSNLLASAPDATWSALTKRSWFDELGSPEVAGRMREERAKAIKAAHDKPLERVRLLLEQPADFPDRDGEIATAIGSPDFPSGNQNTGSVLFFAREKVPQAVLEGFRKRLEAGLELPLHADELLSQLPATDEGPIAAAALDIADRSGTANAAASVVGAATVGALIDRCLEELKTARNDPASARRHRLLESRIEATRPASFLPAVMARADTEQGRIISALAELISRHGDDESRKQLLNVPDDQREAWIKILHRWTDAVIRWPDAERYDLCDVAKAIGRLGLRESADDLQRLLGEELGRLQREREEFAAARGRPRRTSSVVYTNQYEEALARIGGTEAAAVASQYLEDRVFGFEASLVLKSISDKQLNVDQRPFQRWPCLGEIAPAREARAASDRPAPANSLADPIFAAIDRLASAETDKGGQILAIKLARIGLAMPHSNQDALITRVANLPQPLRSKRELFAAMALDGLVLDADTIMGGVDDWLQDTTDNDWQKRQHTWGIEPWLELFPFTNRPLRLIEALTKVRAFYGEDHHHFLERVLEAVTAVPGDAGEKLIVAIARTHKDIARDYDWMKALLNRETESAVRVYIGLFAEGILGSGRQAVDAWHVARELAPLLPRFPQIVANLRQSYEADGSARIQALFEHLVAEIGGPENLIAMVRAYAKTARRFDHHLSEAVSAVTLSHIPVSEGSNTYNVEPEPVSELRQQLFWMMRNEPSQARLAIACLTKIDRLRDEYGIAPSDTRHPDIHSQMAWPIAANDNDEA